MSAKATEAPMTAAPATTGPRVRRIELTPLFVPFREPVRKAMSAGPGGLGMAIPAEGEWTGGDFVIARLTADDGSEGLGEAFVWPPETGVSPGQIIDAVTGSLAAVVIGESPFNVERIRWRMDSNLARHEAAKGLIDMALYDLMGNIAGRPVSDLIGGRSVDRVPLCALVPLMAPDDMAAMAKAFAAAGMRTIRVKLGRGAAKDAEIMARVRESVGPGPRVRVDYNQAYSPSEAVRAIKAIEPFGIDVAEQPVRPGEPLGMVYVQERVDTPLMAHEGCFSLADAVMLIELGAVRAAGVNQARPGGVTNALRLISYAEQRGLGVVLHDQPLGIASAMIIHIAAARHHSLGHDPELFGHVMLEDDLIAPEIEYKDGRAAVPDGSGWGVDLDMNALDKYAAGHTVSIG